MSSTGIRPVCSILQPVKVCLFSITAGNQGFAVGSLWPIEACTTQWRLIRVHRYRANFSLSCPHITKQVLSRCVHNHIKQSFISYLCIQSHPCSLITAFDVDLYISIHLFNKQWRVWNHVRCANWYTLLLVSHVSGTNSQLYFSASGIQFSTFSCCLIHFKSGHLDLFVSIWQTVQPLHYSQPWKGIKLAVWWRWPLKSPNIQ